MKGDNIAARLRAFAAGVLRICRDLDGDSATRHIEEAFRGLVREADELISILTASIRTAKGRLEARPGG